MTFLKALALFVIWVIGALGLWLALMYWFILLAAPVRAEEGRFTLVAGCKLEEETATGNSRPEVLYLHCDQNVSLMLRADTVYAQRARELLGRTGDFKFEPVP